jgi:dihydroorotate dehydrogenase (NAD+) catalytic subunit
VTGRTSKPDMTVKLGQLTLENPVLTASGCFGFGQEYRDYFDLNILGAMVVKGTTLTPRRGNMPPRLVETPAGLLNAIGLQNPGVDRVILEELPVLEGLRPPVIVNVAGSNPDEYVEVARRLAGVPLVAALEINVSCPNVARGGMTLGTCPLQVESLIKSIRQVFPRTLIVKLTPNVTDIREIALGAAKGGADALSLINTLAGMAIDVETQKPVLGNGSGGLSGPALRPVAVRMVWQVAEVVDLPLIGMGGIASAEDALQFILAGASAVAIGTAGLVDPTVFQRVLTGLEDYLVRKDIPRLADLCGLARRKAMENGL